MDLSGRERPNTRDEALDWAIEAICAWRQEAGVSWKPDRGRLAAVLSDLRQDGKAIGISEGLVVYIVLGCEWLLRVGKVGTADADAMLVELEGALAEHIAPELAFWFVEVLASSLRTRISREGRKLFSLQTHLPMAGPGLPRVLTSTEFVRRTRPDPVVPRARGRIPWPAPWVAGALVREFLDRRSVERAGRPLKLTQALFGRRQVEPVDFRVQTQSLTPSVLKWWVETFEHRYGQRFGSAGTSPELWGASLYNDLAVHGPEAVFSSDPGRTHELLQAYGAIRRPRVQKPK